MAIKFVSMTVQCPEGYEEDFLNYANEAIEIKMKEDAKKAFIESETFNETIQVLNSLKDANTLEKCYNKKDDLNAEVK